MDAAFQKGRIAKKRTKPKRAASKKERTGRKDQKRVAQLIVSLMLFLAVFLGRDLYPEQVSAWGELVGADIDAASVFRDFGQALKNDEGFGQALKGMGLALLGEDQVPEPVASEAPKPQISVVPLIETGRFGLDQAKEYGITAAMPEGDAPDPVVSPMPEEKPEIVTAVAQVYTADGEALPSNVSFLYYELGLDNTVVPVSGSVSSGFGYRTSPTTGKREFHLALDIAADKGTAIAAFADGVVRYIGESDEFGLYLMIDHANGVSTFYAHCSKLLVRKGDTVSCGQTVALVGDTGNVTGAHLHLTLLKDNIRLDPAHYVDP